MGAPATASGIEVCDACLRRSWVISRLSAHLDRVRGRAGEVLALGDRELIAALAGRRAAQLSAELERLELGEVRGGLADAGQHALCRCAGGYPSRLRELPNPPAVIYLDGACPLPGSPPGGDPAVAVVGSRGPTPYGREVALMLGRGLARAGLSVISGMAFGIDAAGHHGALKGGGQTVAVLPGGAGRAYPQAHRGLLADIRRSGGAVCELLPGTEPRRWSFTARNRIIAALADVTVVVEATAYSGSLVTARVAGELGRTVGAVPGRVNSPLSEGPHRLLRNGALLVRGVQDVVEELGREPDGPREQPPAAGELAPLGGAAERLYGELLRGADLATAAASAGLDPAGALAAVAELELGGHVRRGPGGAWEPRM